MILEEVLEIFSFSSKSTKRGQFKFIVSRVPRKKIIENHQNNMYVVFTIRLDLTLDLEGFIFK